MRSWTLAIAVLFVGLAQPAWSDEVRPAAEQAPAPQAAEEAAPGEPAAAEGEAAPVADAQAPGEAAPAADAVETSAVPTTAVRWEDFEDPGYDPAQASRAATAEPEPMAAGDGAAAVSPAEAAGVAPASSPPLATGGHSVRLGPKGVDSEGRVGRIHTVVVGDTLWDISEAYLGTAWVWPSVWQDNREIANPHVINPGDLIWITSTMMRPVSAEEADALLSDAGAGETVEEVAAIEEFADDPADQIEAEEIVLPDSMGELPVGVAGAGEAGSDTGRTMHVPRLRNIGLINEQQMDAATSIVGTAEERQWLSQFDVIYLGLGQGDVQVGEKFVLFRNSTSVKDPKTGRFLGYYVNVLGHAEVIEVKPESSVAIIKNSVAGALLGDRAVLSPEVPTEVAIKVAEAGIEGAIAFLPANRTLMGSPDYVYLDVGKVHGLEVGTDLEVYTAGSNVHEPVNRRQVRTPDLVVADLVVVRVEEGSSVAFVAGARRELAVGDTVRSATVYFPSAF